MARNELDLRDPTFALVLLGLVLSFLPKVAAGDNGNDFTNNIMTDIAPLVC
jgi:hypothetical protein